MRYSSSARENWLGFSKARRPTLYTLYVTPEELGALSVLSAIAANSSKQPHQTASSPSTLAHAETLDMVHGPILTRRCCTSVRFSGLRPDALQLCLDWKIATWCLAKPKNTLQPEAEQ